MRATIQDALDRVRGLSLDELIADVRASRLHGDAEEKEVCRAIIDAKERLIASKCLTVSQIARKLPYSESTIRKYIGQPVLVIVKHHWYRGRSRDVDAYYYHPRVMRTLRAKIPGERERRQALAVLNECEKATAGGDGRYGQGSKIISAISTFK